MFTPLRCVIGIYYLDLLNDKILIIFAFFYDNNYIN